MLLYSLFDRKMKEYGQVTVAKNDESVERALMDALVAGAGPVVSHPEDYDMFCVGSFNQDTGVIIGLPPRYVLNAREALERAVESGTKPVLRVERVASDA